MSFVKASSDIFVKFLFGSPDSSDLLLSFLNIKAQDSSDRYYDIEVQTTAQPEYPERSLYYWANRFRAAIEEGERKGEHKGKLETAAAMKAEGLPTEQIARVTGLPEEEIRRL